MNSISKEIIESQLSTNYGWTHDSDNKFWRNGNKFFDYKNPENITLYILAGTGEHYAAHVSPEEFILFGSWLHLQTLFVPMPAQKK